MNTTQLVEMRDVAKVRKGGRGTVVRIPSFGLARGERVAVVGRSGSGKTTLLHLMAGLLAADSGTITVDGAVVSAMSEADRDTFRARTVGVVFQMLNLLQGFTVLENVVLATAFAGKPAGTKAGAVELLTRLGLADKLHHKPGRLSVGEQQRVAVARALVNSPALVLADEPTASLDEENAQRVVDELQRLASDYGTTLVVATHDPAVAGAFERVVAVTEIVGMERKGTV